MSWLCINIPFNIFSPVSKNDVFRNIRAANYTKSFYETSSVVKIIANNLTDPLAFYLAFKSHCFHNKYNTLFTNL